MDFKQAQKEFILLKQAYIVGAISLEEFQEKVDSDLEITDSSGNIWKIDDDGEWLLYDQENETWEEKTPQILADIEEPEEFSLKIEVPASPVFPEKYLTPQPAQEPTQEPEAPQPLDVTPPPLPATEEPPALQQESKPNFCTKCGRKLRADQSFCPGCGKKL